MSSGSCEEFERVDEEPELIDEEMVEPGSMGKGLRYGAIAILSLLTILVACLVIFGWLKDG